MTNAAFSDDGVETGTNCFDIKASVIWLSVYPHSRFEFILSCIIRVCFPRWSETSRHAQTRLFHQTPALFDVQVHGQDPKKKSAR